MPERIVRPGILTSDRVNKLSWPAEVFYRRLMSVVDDYGCFDARVSILRAQLYPLKIESVREADVATWRRECAEAGLVRFYSVDGKEYLQVERFNQRIQGKPKWPLPPPRSTVVHGDPPGSTVNHTKPPCFTDGDGDVDGGADAPPLPPPDPAGGGVAVGGGETLDDAPPPPPPRNGCPPPPRFTAVDVDKILAAYPRQVALRPARQPVEYALVEISHRPEAPADPVAWLLARVQEFARSPAGNKGSKTANPATWFIDARYDDDAREWWKDGSPRELEEAQKQRKKEAADRAMEAAMQRRRQEEARLRAEADPTALADLKRFIQHKTRPPVEQTVGQILKEVAV